MHQNVVIVQARDTSRRLPHKATADLGAGWTPVSLLGRRLRSEEWFTVLAIPDEPASDAIDGSEYDDMIRGPLDDVLARRWMVAEQYPLADRFARVGADDCLQDGLAIGRAFYISRLWDQEYVQTIGWPLGCNAQVVSRQWLNIANASAMNRDEREHLTLFWDRRPTHFPRYITEHEPPRHDVRLTLDTPSDLILMRRIIHDLGPLASVDSIINWWDEHPSEQVHEYHYVPAGTPVPANDPLIRVGFDPRKGDL